MQSAEGAHPGEAPGQHVLEQTTHPVHRVQDHVCSGKTFWRLDRIVHHQLLRWARRTHPNKSYGWLKRKYFAVAGAFGFSTRIRTGTGQSKVLRLYSIAKTVIERHIKVRGEANPYAPVYTGYFERRRCFAWRTLSRGKTGNVLPATV
jgi:hypothetical protein